MDMLYNSDLVDNTTKPRNKMTVQVSGGTIVVTHKATVPGYKQYIWFNKYDITKIISFKNLIKTYQVTYNNINQILLVHREDQ